MKAKDKFKKHTMYDKDGKAYKANTYEQHLAMKKKGYGHEDPKKKKAKKRKASSSSKSFLKKVDRMKGGSY